jgi:membrane-associated phospholipid phosphatase
VGVKLDLKRLLMKSKIFRIIGLAASIIFLLAYIHSPSFPTPDKLLVFLTFVFMSFGQAINLLRRLGPFVAVVLAYESFRSVADKLNSHVNYSLASGFDRAVFGKLPTQYLQNWWWHGHTSWYDYVFYLAYLMHFIIPIGLALIIWRYRDKQYWRVVNTYLVTAFGAFVTFFLFPAAPPWLASNNHFIPHITRISSDVWYGLGLKNFPSFYNHISPNPVAAVPSLHSAWATLLLIFVYKNFGRRAAAVAFIYPFLIYVGTVYEGEHYVFDELAGVIYAVAGYLVTPYLMNWYFRFVPKFKGLTRHSNLLYFKAERPIKQK